MRTLPYVLALVLAGSIFAEPLAHEDVRLAWKFTQGDVLRYRNTMEMEQTISGPMEVKTTTVVAQLLEETVRAVDGEGTATLACAWKAVRMKVESSTGTTLEYDSTDPESTPPEALAGLAKVVGLEFEMRMRPSGELVDLKGLSAAFDQLFSGDDPQSAAMKKTMSEMFDETNMKRTLEVAVLPDHAVKQDEQWKRAVSVPLGPLGKLDAEYVYTFQGLGEEAGTKGAKVGVEYTMKPGGEKPDLSAFPGGDQLDIGLEIDDTKGGGDLFFDVAAGRLARSTLETDLGLTLTMKPKNPPEGATTEPIEMRMEMAMRMDVRLLGPDEPAFEPAAKPKK